MRDIKRKDDPGDCQSHTPACYGESAMECSCNRNEAAVEIQQIGYKGSAPSISTTTTLTGSTSTATTGTTTATPLECLWQSLCSYNNLELAFIKAKRRKSGRKDVKEFECNLQSNLEDLRTDLLLHSYTPKPLKTFVIKDPKVRVIRKSDFRDRVVHHAICNIIEPIFERTFVYDSFANRKGKGTSKAIERFDVFKRKASRNNTRNCFVLKADIRHYFDEVSHNILLSMIREKIKDDDLIWLIKKILKNHSENMGMPLGNLTSQFFANIYLNELDQFIKHILKAKYYIRYVDDFVILSNNKKDLEEYKSRIKVFLKEKLDLDLHETKSRISELKQGISFLGFRIFPYHKLLRKSNLRTMRRKLAQNDYDSVYDYFSGWSAYASHANTYRLRKKISDNLQDRFPGDLALSEINILSRMAEI